MMCVVDEVLAPRLTGSDQMHDAPFNPPLKVDLDIKQELASRLSIYTLNGILDQDYSRGSYVP